MMTEVKEMTMKVVIMKEVKMMIVEMIIIEMMMMMMIVMMFTCGMCSIYEGIQHDITLYRYPLEVMLPSPTVDEDDAMLR